jgi:hypothetical protein
VEQVIAAEGELGSFHTFQKQPAKRELPYEEQLWRFMWNRKERYATLLVRALDLTRVPRPLDRVLAHAYAEPVGSKASALTTGRDAGAG